jgi:hypothetical protein
MVSDGGVGVSDLRSMALKSEHLADAPDIASTKVFFALHLAHHLPRNLDVTP